MEAFPISRGKCDSREKLEVNVSTDSRRSVSMMLPLYPLLKKPFKVSLFDQSFILLLLIS